MVRDKLAEIVAVRGRGQSAPWRGKYAIGDVQRQWNNRTGTSGPPAEFVVIRLVTALEVFTRDWVREIVNAGEPYIGRAAELVKGMLKVDFAVAQALVGKLVTFGDLVAHEIPVNSIGDIDRMFSQLIDEPLFKHLESVIDRWEVEVEGAAPTPILSDPKHTRAQLANLFELRHIIVHEIPEEPHIDPVTVTDFVQAASTFCNAVDQALSTLVDGDYPLTQLEMNSRAGEKAEEAECELQAVLHRLNIDGSDDALAASQDAWEIYRKRQAEFRSNINSPMPGSIAPLLYASEVEKITRARILELEWYLNRSEGEL